MELLLMCFAVAFMVTGKQQKDTAQAAYKAGKEPPGLVKARMRHENGGGGWKPRPGKSSTPKGQGAARLLLSQRWAHACERAKDRADDKHRRWRAWYAEQAPERDEQWRAKQSNRIAKSEQRAEKFARARGILAHPVQTHRDKQEQQAWDENACRDQAAEQSQQSEQDTEQAVAKVRDEAQQLREQEQEQPSSDAVELDEFATNDPEIDNFASELAGTNDGWNSEVFYGAVRDMKQAREAQHAGELATTATSGTDQTGGTVYQQAVAQLHNHADEVEGYRNALTALGDELEGIGWGAEVHGPLTDMRTYLDQAAGRYRDLADDITQQGDAMNDAYDDAPWAPDRAALVQ